MNSKIHPDYHEITVIMTDGTTYKTRSTYGKPGETLHLEIDSRSHPAWTGGQQKLSEGGQLARFNKRFQGQGLGLKPGETIAVKPATKAAAAAAKPAASAEAGGACQGREARQKKAEAKAEGSPAKKPKNPRRNKFLRRHASPGCAACRPDFACHGEVPEHACLIPCGVARLVGFL